MGYEKEKAIVRNDKRRILAKSLHGSGKATIDFADRPEFYEARGTVSTLLCELVDSVAAGDVSYITVGKSRDGGAILCTVNYSNGDKDYAGGSDYVRLAGELERIFS